MLSKMAADCCFFVDDDISHITTVDFNKVVERQLQLVFIYISLLIHATNCYNLGQFHY